MPRERHTENLTRELLNYDKLRLIPQGHSVQSPLEGDEFRTSRQAAQLSFISMLYQMAEDMAAAKVQSATGKAPKM
jgi:hypothetical protein